jgi:hypothetical protein
MAVQTFRVAAITGYGGGTEYGENFDYQRNQTPNPGRMQFNRRMGRLHPGELCPQLGEVGVDEVVAVKLHPDVLHVVSRQFSTAATDATSLRFTFALDEVRGGTPASEKKTACLSSLVDAVAEVSEVLAGARS